MKTSYITLLLLSVFAASAQNLTFSDPNFKLGLIGGAANCIAKNQNGTTITVDANSDGEIQLSEAEAVYELYLGYTNTSFPHITGLGGIEHFSSLRKLHLDNQHVTQLNVTALSHLEELSCNHNMLTSLSVNGLSNLKVLKCNGNATYLTSLSLNGLPNLEILECGSNDFTSLDLSGLHNLKEAWVTYNQLTGLNVAGLSNLEKLSCDHNNLTSINTTGLTALTELNCGVNNISTLAYETMPALETLNCLDNELTSLNISAMPALNYLVASQNPLGTLDFSGQNNLYTVYCDYCSLTSLDVSGSSSLYELHCSGNSLTSLDFSANTDLYRLDATYNELEYLNLKNGSPVNSYISFHSNPTLQYICADEEEIQHFQQNYNLGPNCVVNSYCSFVPGGEFYSVTGSFSYDSDADGCDSADTLLPLQAISVSNGTNSGTFMSGNNDTYSIPLQAGTHVLTPVVSNPGYFSVTPESISVTFPDAGDNAVQNFCLTALGVFNDVETAIVPLEPARPGFDASYRLYFSNRGTTTLSGSITFEFMDDLMDYVSASIIPSLAAPPLLTWDYSNLNPFETRFIDIVMNINSPQESLPVTIDDNLGFTAIITPVEEDTTPWDNRFELKQTVVGSYDPNDKTCLEGEKILPEMAGEYVHYLIRFENTGNYFAQNIVVADIIDTDKFEIATLVPLHASHPYITRITGNKAEFIFEGIELPGMPNEERHGFIAFKIKTLASLQLNDTFSNTAAIYFDYNAPIVTEPAITTFALAMANAAFDPDTHISLYPNPAANTLYLDLKEGISLKNAEVCNVMGQVIIAIPCLSGRNDIDISTLAAGTYFIRAKTNEGVAYARFIKK
ncbi:T9SS type A sorting domain-containing protein [uncultured Flavobacterium sp.]|uniref:DUF7619 domain-containing protein n=1 Tax=uncultured Flavobacterium sp. TaxID=165435 RepID=UPI0025DC1EAB|nr:T9SS type A sorting domain-containing protein [uncultured Flavobacterium sp.]